MRNKNNLNAYGRIMLKLFSRHNFEKLKVKNKYNFVRELNWKRISK